MSQWEVSEYVHTEVKLAMECGFNQLDREIISHALDGNNEVVFQPLNRPKLLHCEGVVTLWRFIHDAVDAPKASVGAGSRSAEKTG